jgi:hypothetical protein
VVYDPRADVRGAGDVTRVAEPVSYVVHSREHVLLSLLEVFRGAERGQLDRGDQGSRPGAEVLGDELGTHDLSYVGVQVAGFHVPDLARAVTVLEDLLAR